MLFFRERNAADCRVCRTAARGEQAVVESDDTSHVVCAFDCTVLFDCALDDIDGCIACAAVRALVLADDTADVIVRTRNGCGDCDFERARLIRLCVCDVRADVEGASRVVHADEAADFARTFDFAAD